MSTDLKHYQNSFSDSFDTDSEQNKSFQTTIKQLLQARLFLGNYKEKKYVASLNTYRDVIYISNNEKELIDTLDIVLKRINEQYNKKWWIGITNSRTGVNAPVGHCLWTELPDRPFGKYWFQIKTVRFRSNEVLCKLKCIRPMNSDDVAFQYAKKESIHEFNETEQVTPDWNNYVQELKHSTNVNLYYFFKNCLTLNNIIQIMKFIFILLISLGAGAISGIRYIGEFSLRFIHETSYFVHAATPMFLGIIDLIAKMIGGFYILIAMIWKGGTQKNTIPTNFSNQINYNRRIPAIQNSQYRRR